MTIYTELAQQVISQLGEGRALVEQAIADEDNAGFIASLKFFSDRYYELVGWGLDPAGRDCLEAAIRVELGRTR